jgi:glutamyl/glutaminyl-tRNA synthetase
MKNLLIKLNDVVIDTSSNYDKAIKKSLEFFMGNLMHMDEIKEFRERKCPVTNEECILEFLNEKNIFLRERAILKKFSEYYLGKEFEGLIKESKLLIDKKTIEKLSKKYKIVFLSLMPKEETEFLMKKMKLDKFKAISASSLDEGIKKAKAKLKHLKYLGNTELDYNEASKHDISFIGLKTGKGERIEKIDQLI